MQLVCELERESSTNLQIQPLLWRFDLLADPDWQPLAAADAARAELLIVAAASRELPLPVRNWLTASLPRETVTHKALVALLGIQGQTASGLPSLVFLENVAKERGLAFFVPSPQAAGFHSNGVHDPQPPLDYGRDEMFQANKGYRHWGLNE